jgi:epoxide hydrolase
MQEFCDYWQNQFDWRAQEKPSTNSLTSRRDRWHRHPFHPRAGEGRESHAHYAPVRLAQLFLADEKIIPLLTDPQHHDGEVSDSFDVIVPDLPGYGFLTVQRRKAFLLRIGDLFARLMTDGLGHKRFAVRATDLGTGAAQQLGLVHSIL